MIKSKKTSVEVMKSAFRNSAGSLVYSSLCASTFIGLSCVLRNLLGKFFFWTIVFIPAFSGSLFVFAEKQHIELFNVTYSNLIMELWVRQLQDSKILTWTATQQTFIFMMISASLSYIQNDKEWKSRIFWFFSPPKKITNTELTSGCFHSDSCWKNILKLFAKYFSTGFLLQLAKVLFSNFGQAKVIGSSLLRLDTYKFAAFMGFYVGIYQAIRCLLYRRQNEYSAIHDMVAGFLAGAAFRFRPNISIFNSAVITVIQLLAEIGFKRDILPKLPYGILVHAFFNGTMFHSRFYFQRQCPGLIAYIMSTATCGRADLICDRYTEFYRKIVKTLL